MEAREQLGGQGVLCIEVCGILWGVGTPSISHLWGVIIPLWVVERISGGFEQFCVASELSEMVWMSLEGLIVFIH